MVGAIN